jgi:hypothetical protein
VKNIPKNFPSVEDAVKDFRNSIYGIVQEISLEYTECFKERMKLAEMQITATQLQ